MKTGTGRKKRGKTAIFAVAVLLFCMYLNMTHVLSHRETDHEIRREKLPLSLIVVTMALGPIRGIVADALWWRVIDLQAEGNYFEIITLTDWITSLQPRNTYVWTFSSWNLSYNVAYEFPDSESRWKWLMQSIRLLRDEALEYNPGNDHIRNELGAVIFDRLVKDYQKDHLFFKKRWAESIIPYIGSSDREQLLALAAVDPDSDRIRENPLLKPILIEAGNMGFDLLAPDTFAERENWPEKIRRLFSGENGRYAYSIIDSYYKRTMLRKKFRLDSERMLSIDRIYGPFDWRMPYAHAVYWMADSDVMAGGLNYGPIIRRSMRESFLRGRLIYDENGKVFSRTCILESFKSISQYHKRALRQGTDTGIENSYRNFLEDATLVFFSMARRAESVRIFEYCRKQFYPGTELEYEDFVRENLFPELHEKSYKGTELVKEALKEAYSAMALGEFNRARGYADFALMNMQDSRMDIARLKEDALREVLENRNLTEKSAERLMKWAKAPSLPPRSQKEIDLGLSD